METKQQRTQRAVVVGKSGDKTIRVQIDSLRKDPKYEKYVRRRTRLGVHDPRNQACIGDLVEITQCRPISKTKNWRLVGIVQKAVIQE